MRDGDGLAVIRRRARRMGVPLTEARPAALLGWDRDGIEVDLPRLGPTRIGLRGRHQAANAAIADATLDALEAAGIASVPPDARRRGYADAVWPGRLELLRVGDRDVLLDGAHNPAGAAALAAVAGRPAAVPVAGADHPRDGVDGGQGCRRRRPGARRVRGPGRCDGHLHEPRRAAGAAGLRARRPVAGDPSRARARGRPIRSPRSTWPSSDSGPVLVAGSLYLVGAVRAHLVDDPILRDPDPEAP